MRRWNLINFNIRGQGHRQMWRFAGILHLLCPCLYRFRTRLPKRSTSVIFLHVIYINCVYMHLNVFNFFIVFQENCRDFEETGWFETLVFYGFKRDDTINKSDDDVRLLPNIVEKVLLPKVTSKYGSCFICYLCVCLMTFSDNVGVHFQQQAWTCVFAYVWN